ncbi:MAG: tol-pal system-associated acyl-CoA thioesterase [Limnohabitans sp.]|nr:tol-pal system-associated acyl-CoA thioesterase [Limnohabitans sp.]
MIFKFPIRVYWEDTDAGGIVFYANYLKFFERTRTEWLRSLGIEQNQLKQQTGGMFVVSQTQVTHHLPAVLDDQLEVTAQMQSIGRASLIIQQQNFRKNPQGQPSLLTEGTIRIGWIQADTFKPNRIPPNLLERLT